jgi:hypothetical protein
MGSARQIFYAEFDVSCMPITSSGTQKLIGFALDIVSGVGFAGLDGVAIIDVSGRRLETPIKGTATEWPDNRFAIMLDDGPESYFISLDVLSGIGEIHAFYNGEPKGEGIVTLKSLR